MNILKAADDIKNFSDQQLLSAGENPVMLPPYLVLAEMKRREQMRAEFAKSQQQQQPPTVIQQTAQNLAQSQQQQGQPQQGQPQQGMPQQPQAQGIMQGAPQQVMAMASGGYVPRYAAGTPKPDPLEQLRRFSADSGQVISNMGQQVQDYKAPDSLSLSPQAIRSQFQQKPVKDYLSILDELQGKRDYNAEQEFVDLQTQTAKKNKARSSFGDALIAAGAGIASNPDNRLGILANIAKNINLGNQVYKAANKDKDDAVKAAMAGQVSLGRMKQDDLQKRVATALQMSQGDQTKLIEAYKIAQTNERFYEGEKNKVRNNQEKMRLDGFIESNRINLKALEISAEIAGRANVANINAASRQATAKNKDSNRANNYGASNAQALMGLSLRAAEDLRKQLPNESPGTPAYNDIVNKIRAHEEQYANFSIYSQMPNVLDPGITGVGSNIRVVNLSKGSGTK